MRKLIATLLLTAMAASPAMAWGPREQGILSGVAGLWIIQQLNKPNQSHVHIAPPPVVPYYPGTVYPDYTYRPMYRMVDIFIPECNCYRTVMVQVN